MVKGRRAADRRRERQGGGSGEGGGDDEGGDGKTSPSMGAPNAEPPGAPREPSRSVARGPPESAKAEASKSVARPRSGASVAPLDSEVAPDDDDLPVVSQIREVEPDPPTRTAKARGGRAGDTDGDAEESFVKAVRDASADARRGPGDITVDGGQPVAAPRRGARLLVLEGPDQGAKLDVAITPALLGRTRDADLKLGDAMVSLRHAELALLDDGWVLFDLGSTSGTLVNGRPFGAEQVLRHGDVLAVGQSELRFLRADRLPAERPEPEPEPLPVEQAPIEATERLESTRSRLARLPKRAAPPPPPPNVARARVRLAAVRVIAACVALLGLAVAGRVVWDRFVGDRSEAQVRTQVASLLAESRRQLAALDVEGARASAQTVLALDASNSDAASMLRLTDTELEAKSAVDLALRLGDEERDAEALQVLKRVPDSSVFAASRERLRRTLDERGVQRSRRQIALLLDQDRVKEALALAEQHVAQWPNDAEGAALRERAAGAVAARPKNPELSAARAAFAAGDLARARATAQAASLAGYLRDLEEFERKLAAGKAALKRLEGSEALEPLDDAWSLLGTLGGNASSPVVADVKKPFANALYLAGTELLDGPKRCEGARLLFRAARVMSGDAKIDAQLRDIDERAVAGLERARGARVQDAARAAAIAREHLCLAKTGTRTYEELRALSRL
ncbi:MAG: FHA domain-containing protein [Deltaproteobacteria bacterium]|nr:FHA domain-containing protein [Deltaproteobacteria bacterium]